MDKDKTKIRMAPRSAIKNPDLPVCPKHNRNMVFDRSDTTWKCGTLGCRVVARRKDDSSETQQKIKRKFNVSLEIISGQDEDDNYVLVASVDGERTIVDVTDYVDMIIDEQTNSVTLCLMFHHVKRVRL